MYVYMLVSNDKYEFPLIIADSAFELARRIGVKERTISSAICHHKERPEGKCRYHKVDIGDLT